MSSRHAFGAGAMVLMAFLYGVMRDGRLEAVGDEPDPTLFLVELSHDGQQILFRDVEGLSPANAQPGQKTAGRVALRRAFTLSRDLWDWRVHVLAGDSPKTEVTIRLLDDTLQEVARWNLAEAFPEAVIESLKDGIAYEELVVAHNGLTMVAPAAQ